MKEQHNVTAQELRQFIERFERLEADRQDIIAEQKETLAEAKARGYCVKTIREIIKLRKKRPDDAAEQQAILDLYKNALGML